MNFYRDSLYSFSDLARKITEFEKHYDIAREPLTKKFSNPLRRIALGAIAASTGNPLAKVAIDVAGDTSPVTEFFDGLVTFTASKFGAFKDENCQNYFRGNAMRASHLYYLNRLRDLEDFSAGRENWFETKHDRLVIFHSAPAYIFLTGFILRNSDIQLAHNNFMIKEQNNTYFLEKLKCCLKLAEDDCLNRPYKNHAPPSGNSPCAIGSTTAMLVEEVNVLQMLFGATMSVEHEYQAMTEHLKSILPAIRSWFDRI